MPTTIGRGDAGNDDQPPPSVTDNPTGYVRPNEGYDPDGDGVLNPMRAAQVSERHDLRDAAGSGKFVLDAEAMNALLPRWENVKDRLMKLRGDADRLEAVEPPARDTASLRQIDAVKRHREIYAEIIKQQFEYAEAYVKSLKLAIAKVEESDRAAGTAVREAGGAVDA